MAKNADLGNVIHYQPSTSILTVEDPQFVFFLRNLGWNKFAEQVGFVNLDSSHRYDYALSFAGPDRSIAEALFDSLTEHELQIFYDHNEQARILAENIEDYLGPIYASEARYVVCLLGKDYPKRVWTTFESRQFKSRFGERSVIPIWFTDAPTGAFDESTRVGGLHFDPSKPADEQVAKIAELLVQKLVDQGPAQATVAAADRTQP